MNWGGNLSRCALGLWVQGSGVRVLDSLLRALGLGSRVEGSGFRVEG